MFYKEKDLVEPDKVWQCLNNINVTSKNANVLVSLLLEKGQKEKYNFKAYMKQNCNK